jgi:hypothetical protein
LLAKAVITPNQYDARNVGIGKEGTFGTPAAPRTNVTATYNHYVGDPAAPLRFGKKFRKYVRQASRYWPTRANPNQPPLADPNQPYDYVRI